MIKLLCEDDRKEVLDYLGRNEIECTFLIGNVNQFGIENRKEYRRCGDYIGYFEGMALKGILPIYNMGSCLPHFESSSAVDEFIKIAKGRKIDYLLGMKKYVEPIYEGIKDSKKVLEYSDNSYYINNNFKEFSVPDVEILDASEIKLDDALDFMVEARKLGFHDNVSRRDVYNALTQRANEENFIFLLKEGKIAAQACIQAATSKINQIGSVYTTESQRENGFCKAIVSRLCSIIIGRGKIPTLMVRKNNTPAVKAYSYLGFEHYDDYNIIKLG